ncbi:MAG: hypothetical protein Q9221_008387, partial [Calogaya cf. arnoldii]
DPPQSPRPQAKLPSNGIVPTPSAPRTIAGVADGANREDIWPTKRLQAMDAGCFSNPAMHTRTTNINGAKRNRANPAVLRCHLATWSTHRLCHPTTRTRPTDMARAYAIRRLAVLQAPATIGLKPARLPVLQFTARLHALWKRITYLPGADPDVKRAKVGNGPSHPRVRHQVGGSGKGAPAEHYDG